MTSVRQSTSKSKEERTTGSKRPWWIGAVRSKSRYLDFTYFLTSGRERDILSSSLRIDVRTFSSPLSNPPVPGERFPFLNTKGGCFHVGQIALAPDVSLQNGGHRQMSRHIFFASTLVLLAGIAAPGQIGSSGAIEPRTDVPYWVNYWSRPPLIMYGPDEQAFYQSMQVILFPNDNHDDPLDPGALDANVRWLTDHPNVQFYVNGYASSEGSGRVSLPSADVTQRLL